MTLQLSLSLVDTAAPLSPFAYAAAQPLPFTTAAIYSLMVDNPLPAMPDRNTIAGILGVNVRTVANGIRRLTAAALIKDTGNRHGKTGRIKEWDTFHKPPASAAGIPADDANSASAGGIPADAPRAASGYGKATPGQRELIASLQREILAGTSVTMERLRRLVNLEPVTAADADLLIKELKSIKSDPVNRRRKPPASLPPTGILTANNPAPEYPPDYGIR